jgi:hypothetical protein
VLEVSFPVAACAVRKDRLIAFYAAEIRIQAATSPGLVSEPQGLICNDSLACVECPCTLRET